MIALFGFVFGLLAVCWLLGTALLAGVRSLVIDKSGDRWILSAWVGCLSLAAALLLLSTITPLTPLRAGVCVVVALTLSLLSSEVRAECRLVLRAFSWTRAYLLSGVALVIAALFTRPVVLYDTGLYHYGSINWLSRFGAVEGVGLLEARLGWGSSWFALLAPFNAGPFEARLTQVGAVLVLLLAVLHIVVFGQRCLRKVADPADWFGLLGLGLAFLTLPFELASSPSPDVPIPFVIVEAAYVLVRLFQTSDVRVRGGLAVVASLLSGGALAVKFSALPLAAFTMIALLFARLPFARLALAAIGSAAMAAPVLLFNTLASGCPLNPANLCLATSWAPSAQQRATMTDQVQALNQWGGARPPDATALNWIWRRWLVPETSLNLVVLAFALLVLAFVSWQLVRREVLRSPLAGCGFFGVCAVVLFERRFPNILIALAVAVGWAGLRRTHPRWTRMTLTLGLFGTAFTLFAAPLVRLCAGFLAVAAASMITPAGEPLGSRADKFRTTSGHARGSRVPATALLVLAVLAALFYVPGIGRGPVFSSSRDVLLLPAALPSPAVETVVAQGVRYHVPTTGEQCWAVALPCLRNANQTNTFRLQDPDAGIEGGFMLVDEQSSKTSRDDRDRSPR